MPSKSDLKKLEEKLSNTNLNDVTSWGGSKEDLERGLSGENKVFDIISKYVDKVYRDVVIWNKKHTMVIEADYIIEINGYLLIIEVKEWFGKMTPSKEDNKVILTYVNKQGLYVKRERTNPLYAVGAFSNDLLFYLKPNSPKKHIQLKKCVVFSRDDIEIDIDGYNTEIFKLDDFDKYLSLLAKEENNEPYQLNKELPSWDYIYTERDDKWHKVAILSIELETDKGMLKISDVDSILFNQNYSEPSLIKFKDDTYLEAVINREKIEVNKDVKFLVRRVARFIKLNKQLHSNNI